ETNEWTREKITYASLNGDRAIAYLYLPKHFPGPFQVIQLFPAGDVHTLLNPLPTSAEFYWMGLVRSGRALFSVVHKGWHEREDPPGYVRPPYDSAEFAEGVKTQIFELRRGLDYLATRTDINMNQVAFFYASAAGPE